jgi:hypothetical protein
VTKQRLVASAVGSAAGQLAGPLAGGSRGWPCEHYRLQWYGGERPRPLAFAKGAAGCYPLPPELGASAQPRGDLGLAAKLQSPHASASLPRAQANLLAGGTRMMGVGRGKWH